MHINQDVRPLHRLAVTASVDLIATVALADLDRATPCTGWTLRDLVCHMTVQHRGFAAAARGRGADLSVWDPATVADAVAADPAGAYAAAAEDVLEAFSADGVLDAAFALAELGPDFAVPGSMAIGFHFIDYVAHGWDVARTLGVPFALPAEVVSAVLPLTLAVPDGEFRDTPGSPFARGLTPEEGASDLDRVLMHLGRSPRWTPAPVTEGR